VVVDAHNLSVPADLLPGRYDLWAGLYDLASNVRQPVTQQPARDPERVWLGSLDVR
jgi:hypothetical protein